MSVQTNGINNTNISLGTMVTLICTADAGSHPLIFTWQHPDENILPINSISLTVKEITFRISSTSDYGNYICTAFNEVGSDSATIEIVQPQGRNIISKINNSYFIIEQ